MLNSFVMFHLTFSSKLSFSRARVPVLRPFSINVRFARAGEASIVFDARHARVQPRPQGLPRGGARAEEDPGKIR